MRIDVMAERCIGAGNCVEVAPSYFDQDDLNGTVKVLKDEVGEGDEAMVAGAADICPVAAILLSAQRSAHTA
jgi:ferredoxin